MQGGGEDFYHHTGGNLKCLDLCGVQNAVLDLFLPGQQQNEILGAQIKLAVPVVFQAVELGVMAVAPAKLGGHAAEAMFADFDSGGQFLQHRIGGNILYMIGAGGRGQGSQDFLDGFVHAGDDLAIGLELGIVNRINLHRLYSLISSANRSLQAG